MLEGQEHSFKPWETTAPHIIYVLLGFFIAIFGMFSLLIKERLYLGEAPIALVFGIIVGPVAASIFSPVKWGNNGGFTPGNETTNEITVEVMRVCIALSVFSVGVELPRKYVMRHWRTLVFLLGPVMLWSWMISALLIWALIPGLDFLNSLVIASCLSPTDPILAQAVVGGPWAEKHVPSHIRYMLQCESGCNDGAAFPFLYIAYYLTVNRGQVGFPVAKWFYQTWAWEICLGTLIGAVIGYVARKLMRFSERYKLVDRESFVAQYLSLALASMGLNVLLGSDDLLAAFACGTAFAWDGWFSKETEDSNFSNIVDLVFNIATFVYIGAVMPWHTFNDSTIGCDVWRLIVLAILVLICKRIPIVLMVWKWVPDIKTFREALFTGHFGPMGVGAIFMCTYARLMLPENAPYPPLHTNDTLVHTIQPIVFFFVLTSVIVHGFTVPFFAFGQRAHKNITRTLTTYATMATTDEPGWLSSVRRIPYGTNADLPQDEHEGREDNEEEREEREALDSKISSTVAAMHKAGNEPDLEKGEHQREDQHLLGADAEDEDVDVEPEDDPEGDWGGESTMEMKKFREQQRGHEHEPTAPAAAGETDVADATRGRYPKLNHWLEGEDLVLEYTKGPQEEPIVEIIKLTPEEHEMFYAEESPLRSWIESHTYMMESLIGVGMSHFGNRDLFSIWKHGIKRKLKGGSEKEEQNYEGDYDEHMRDAEILYAGLRGHGLENERRLSDPTEKSLFARVSRNLKPFTDTRNMNTTPPDHIDPAGARRGSLSERLGSMMYIPRTGHGSDMHNH